MWRWLALGPIFVLGGLCGTLSVANAQCKFDQEVFFGDQEQTVGNEVDKIEPGRTKKLVATCGHTSSLLRTYALRSNRVELPGGRFLYPVLLSDKRDGEFRCNRIKVRNACVLDAKRNADRITVKLAQFPDGSGRTATWQIDAESGRILESTQTSTFALARFERRLDNVAATVPEHIKRRVD